MCKKKRKKSSAAAPEVTTKQQKNETAPQVLAYRHPGRRSESETDDDRNRPLK